jgi:hypothetical protein
MSTKIWFRNQRFLKSLRRKAFQQQQGLCWYCNLPMWFTCPDELLGLDSSVAWLAQCTAEHLIARCDGGKDAADNIVAACARCNDGRHQLPVPPQPSDYRRYVQIKLGENDWHHPSVMESCLRRAKAISALKLPIHPTYSKSDIKLKLAIRILNKGID